MGLPHILTYLYSYIIGIYLITTDEYIYIYIYIERERERGYDQVTPNKILNNIILMNNYISIGLIF